MDSFKNKISMPSSWDPNSNQPELTSKVIVVTGGNAGIGFETILQLARRKPSRIYLTARSQSKYDGALDKISQEISNARDFIRFIPMDLSSLSSVRDAAKSILADTDRLDTLINNAGIMGASPDLTKDGYETHFGTNHMGHALFTRLLLPLLQRTATTGADVRIINVSSAAYAQAPSFDDAQVKTAMSSSMMLSRYGQSKLANVLHARELARRYRDITAVSIHPGRVATGLLDGMYAKGVSAYGLFQNLYDWFAGPLTTDKGAWNQVWAATVAKDQLVNGAYYIPVGKLDAGNAKANDEALAKRLWEWQEQEFARLGLV